MLSLFAKLWKRGNSLIQINKAKGVAIFATSYSTTETALADATKANLVSAIAFAKKIGPEAVIIFCSCSHPFPGAAEYEEQLKTEMCEKMGVKFISAGYITNSVTEMDAVKRALAEHNIQFESLLIVTCDLHSPSELCLAKILFPQTNILLWCNSYALETQKDHPTPNQRTMWRWLPVSIIRLCAFKAASWGVISLDRLRCIHHSGGK